MAGVASAIEVPLLVTHVLAAATSPLEADAQWRVRHAMAKIQLELLRHELPPSAHVHLLLETGQPSETIARITEERRIGLVVMGLRGMGGPDGRRPGSIAYRVLCLAPALLLAIPPVLAKHAASWSPLAVHAVPASRRSQPAERRRAHAPPLTANPNPNGHR